jgi:hypothetical protein
MFIVCGWVILAARNIRKSARSRLLELIFLLLAINLRKLVAAGFTPAFKESTKSSLEVERGRKARGYELQCEGAPTRGSPKSAEWKMEMFPEVRNYFGRQV